MALFKKKAPSDAEPEKPFEPQPEKARKWFEHAKTSAMSSNYDYALSCFANGIRLDPSGMSAHEGMLDAAVRYRSSEGKPASSKELKDLDDGTPVGKFAAAELEWMKDLKNPKPAIKMLEAAIKAEQLEFGNWIAPKIANLINGQKKLSKAALLHAMDLFRQVGAWNESMAAGEMARQLDPTDSALDSELKNLSAQRAMDQGGYSDAVGQEGGFRKFIRDAGKQQELIEEDTIAGGGSLRTVDRARAAYEATPTVPDIINRYAQLLKKDGTLEGLEQARAVYQKGFDDTGEYRFRMSAGDLEIELLERTVRALEDQLESKQDDPGLTARLEQSRKKLLDLKVQEFTERVQKYPTDRFRKYDLGTIQFDLGNYDDAMAQFQKAKDEPKLRVRAGHMLGRCFFREGWYSDAAAELREALGAIDATEKNRELSVKYDLMLALLGAAREESSIDDAKDAKSICSEIARTDITYRDIRAKRKEVETLVRELDGGGG